MAGLNPDIALVRILYGIVGGGVIIIFYHQLRKKCTLLEKVISEYSLEIYLIHNGILGRTANIVFFNKGNIEIIASGITMFLAFLFLPILVALCEKYFSPLRFVFHPMK